ncbi:hypothetical protein C1645_828817 [Glomus cerebriforme]|uniref:Protein kinase domain-containing protein n=1 Tax=Glomus cerebriforme TaxID=658196 RepID=A0A397SL41_9GLOM|nr:hypothetical protein C1645_828817 [Glomus cerebriforme]
MLKVLTNKCIKCCEIYTNIMYKWCQPCQMNYLKENFTNWTSENEEIDNLIQELQLKINDYNDVIFEWISYNQFINVKETENNGIATAIWKNGPLDWNEDEKKYVRDSNKIVALKYLNNSQNVTNEFLNKKCVKQRTDIWYKWCELCQIHYLKENFTNWTSGNEEIDDLIQKIQLKINDYNDMIFKWIPYNQFIDVKEIDKDGIATAIWKDGPLDWKNKKNKPFFIRVNHYLGIKIYFSNSKAYGISQNPETKDYIMVLHNKYPETYCVHYDKIFIDESKYCKPCQINHLKENFTNWTSGNEEIDNLIQKMQLKIDNCNNEIFEWISYNQFINVKEIDKDGIATAIWKDGPLNWNNKPLSQEYDLLSQEDSLLSWEDKYDWIVLLHRNKGKKKYIRDSNKEVALKPYEKRMSGNCHQNCPGKYLDNSQNVINGFLNKIFCGPDYAWAEVYYANSKPYGISQTPNTNDYIIIFNKEKFFEENCENCGKDDITTARWKDGPLYWNKNEKKYTRNSCIKVILKYFDNSRNIINGFLDEVKEYFENYKVYGISQNLSTKDYAIIFNNGKFQMTYLEGIFTNQCDNEEIDDLILELQLKINNYNVKIFKWIPYNQFDDIKKIGEGGFATVYSAIWRNGHTEVALKYLNNSQNITSEFLNEIKAYSIIDFDNFDNSGKVLRIYGISQYPNTKDYIIVLQYAKGNILFVTDSMRVFSNDNLYISDMGLCGEVDNIDKTKIYGVMPYVAPEVLRGKSSLDICEGIRPEINEPEAPECYIDLMKKCWNSNPDNRPNTIEIEKLIKSFYNSYCSTSTKQEVCSNVTIRRYPPSIYSYLWMVDTMFDSDILQKSSDILGFYPLDNNTDGYLYPQMMDIRTMYPGGG